MLPDRARQAILPWIPAAYCTLISFMVFFPSGPRDLSSGQIMFFCFLPMAFIFAGFAMREFQAQVRELRKQVVELEDKLGVVRPVPIGKKNKGRFQFSLFDLLFLTFIIAFALGLLVVFYKALYL